MSTTRNRPHWAMGTGLAAALIVPTIVTGGHAQAGAIPASIQTATVAPAVLPADPSPAGCHISHIGWPHESRSVPGAVKVNAIATCNRPVEQQSLSVTLVDRANPAVPIKK